MSRPSDVHLRPHTCLHQVSVCDIVPYRHRLTVQDTDCPSWESRLGSSNAIHRSSFFTVLRMLSPESQQARRPDVRRLLPDTVVFGAAQVPFASTLAAAVAAPMAAAQNQSSQAYSTPFNLAPDRFNPSVVIVLAILLSAFFFMGFFSLYVRRCGGRSDGQGATSRRAAAEGFPNGSSQGLDPCILHSLPLIAYSSAKKRGNNIECVVCLTEFEEQEPLRQLPSCKHVFHQDCIDMWLLSHSTCPLCRRKIGIASSGSMSFRWGSGSFRHLPFLTRGSSGVPQNAPPASSEEAGTMSLIESGMRPHTPSRRGGSVGICRSASAEMSNVPSNVRRPWESVFNKRNEAIAEGSGEGCGQDTAGASSRHEHGLHLGRANSTGHCLAQCGPS